MLKDLLIDGIIQGLGSVIVFLPNILILFFLISLMEDTGYMARAAFIMDKLMHKMGLHGRSFIPMVMDLVATYLQLWLHVQFVTGVIGCLP